MTDKNHPKANKAIKGLEDWLELHHRDGRTGTDLHEVMDNARCQLGNLLCEIDTLEQAIKRIEEAANAPIKIVWDSENRTPPVVQGLDKLLKEVADAAKKVGEV